MENDTIRSSGGNTLVDLWVEGGIRSICVSRAAIEGHLRLAPDAGAAMSDDDRCTFVRNNLVLIVAAARNRLRETGTASGRIVIDAGQLGARGERRKAERRTDDRRKGDRPQQIPSTGDRRRGPRRNAERRAKAKPEDKG